MAESLAFDKREERLRGAENDQISSSSFNLIMTLTILYGLVINVFTVAYASAPLLRWIAGFEDKELALIGILAVYFVVSIGGILLSAFSAKPLVSFIGFTLVALSFGVLLCLSVPFFEAQIVLKAVIITACVTAVMTMIAIIKPEFFLKLGTTLFIALLVGLIAEIVAVFAFHYKGTFFDWLFVIIFSGYIGFDISRSQQYSKTVDNAIDCAVDLYMDIINLFVRLLSILSKKK